jgi:hypothetical protein
VGARWKERSLTTPGQAGVADQAWGRRGAADTARCRPVAGRGPVLCLHASESQTLLGVLRFRKPGPLFTVASFFNEALAPLLSLHPHILRCGVGVRLRTRHSRPGAGTSSMAAVVRPAGAAGLGAQADRPERRAGGRDATEQADAADEGRLDASGSIIVGPVIVNEGRVVRPSQLIRSVRQTTRDREERDVQANGRWPTEPMAGRVRRYPLPGAAEQVRPRSHAIPSLGRGPNAQAAGPPRRRGTPRSSARRLAPSASGRRIARCAPLGRDRRYHPSSA